MAPDSSPVRAARLILHGEPLSVEPVDLPETGPDEVRVTLQFGGINPIDRYTALGRVNPEAPLPRTLGGEAAGELDGRPVLVAGERLGGVRDGVWSQAAVVPAAAVVELPAGVQPRDAAAMGIAGLTALNCVRHLAAVTPEDRVLVLGASGGVGSMIVSLARAAGATVWGQTGSPEKVAAIVADGAQRAVVGGPEQIAAEIDQFEPTVAFDPLGGGFAAVLVQAVAPRGRIVSFGVSAGAEVTFNLQLLYRKMVSLLGYGGMIVARDERRAGLQEALEAVRAGELKVRIDEVLALERVNEAFARLVDRQVQGNLLLDLS
ncbi:MAG TPA: zinc-binding alcohol dehydrogenase family protein [Solirubrobacteraceae bacterium]